MSSFFTPDADSSDGRMEIDDVPPMQTPDPVLGSAVSMNAAAVDGSLEDSFEAFNRNVSMDASEEVDLISAESMEVNVATASHSYRCFLNRPFNSTSTVIASTTLANPNMGQMFFW